jgi:hypothetical protein
MAEVIDKVLLDRPLTIQPTEGAPFGPIDVRGAERVNVMATIQNADAKVDLQVDFNRGDLFGTAATENFGKDATATASVPVFGPEVTVSVANFSAQPVEVRLVTVYAVRLAGSAAEPVATATA